MPVFAHWREHVTSDALIGAFDEAGNLIWDDRDIFTNWMASGPDGSLLVFYDYVSDPRWRRYNPDGSIAWDVPYDFYPMQPEDWTQPEANLALMDGNSDTMFFMYHPWEEGEWEDPDYMGGSYQLHFTGKGTTTLRRVRLMPSVGVPIGGGLTRDYFDPSDGTVVFSWDQRMVYEAGYGNYVTYDGDEELGFGAAYIVRAWDVFTGEMLWVVELEPNLAFNEEEARIAVIPGTNDFVVGWNPRNSGIDMRAFVARYHVPETGTPEQVWIEEMVQDLSFPVARLFAVAANETGVFVLHSTTPTGGYFCSRYNAEDGDLVWRTGFVGGGAATYPAMAVLGDRVAIGLYGGAPAT